MSWITIEKRKKKKGFKSRSRHTIRQLKSIHLEKKSGNKIVTTFQSSKEAKEENLTNLTESSYLICTLLIDIFRFPIIVAIREPSHEFPLDCCKRFFCQPNCYFPRTESSMKWHFLYIYVHVHICILKILQKIKKKVMVSILLAIQNQ